MATQTKPFEQLTEEEATNLARECKRGCETEDEIRANLTAAGFDGAGASIDLNTSQGMTQCMVMVYGPNDEIISC